MHGCLSSTKGQLAFDQSYGATLLYQEWILSCSTVQCSALLTTVEVLLRLHLEFDLRFQIPTIHANLVMYGCLSSTKGQLAFDQSYGATLLSIPGVDPFLLYCAVQCTAGYCRSIA